MIAMNSSVELGVLEQPPLSPDVTYSIAYTMALQYMDNSRDAFCYEPTPATLDIMDGVSMTDSSSIHYQSNLAAAFNGSDFIVNTAHVSTVDHTSELQVMN